MWTRLRQRRRAVAAWSAAVLNHGVGASSAAHDSTVYSISSRSGIFLSTLTLDRRHLKVPLQVRHVSGVYTSGAAVH